MGRTHVGQVQRAPTITSLTRFVPAASAGYLKIPGAFLELLEILPGDLDYLDWPGYPLTQVIDMTNQAVIPVNVVRDQIAGIDLQLAELKRQSGRIKEEEARLTAERSILAKLEQSAVTPHARGSGSRKRGISPGDTESPSQNHVVPNNDIPDGRVATPIILQMIHDRPGIKSVEVIDALAPSISKEKRRGPRKFLADLIWELGHRKKLFRKPSGSLYLTEQGGE